jgi:phenylacetate-CoA ligase
VGITSRDRDAWTEVVSRVYTCEGVRPDDVVVHGFGLGFFVGGLPLKDAIENIGATFVPIGTGASERLVTAIRDLRATGGPSYAYRGWLVSAGRPGRAGAPAVLLGAEPAARSAVRRRRGHLQGVRHGGLGNAISSRLGARATSWREPSARPDASLEPSGPMGPPRVGGRAGRARRHHLTRECVPLVRFRVGD